MKAMLLNSLVDMRADPAPLTLAEVPEPLPAEGEVLLHVTRCGVCHTELDEIEGRTPPPRFPMILGHQVVGTVVEGPESHPAYSLRLGQRVGVAWIGSTCGKCEYCLSGQENLCTKFQATGRDLNGGYAEFMTVSAGFVHPIPDAFTDSEAAPLLCAGAIGYRSVRLSNIRDGRSLGLMGFGGSNHLVLKMIRHRYPNSEIYVFTRSAEERDFAISLGAAWAGAIDDLPPEQMHAIIDTTPVWAPDMQALKHLKPGGRLIINAIRKQETDKEALLGLNYPSQLWMEKEIKSVANVTRADVREFLQLAAEADIRPELQEYDLEDANQALLELKQGRIRGAKVLRVG